MKNITKVSSLFKALILAPSLFLSTQVFAQTNPVMVVKGGPFWIMPGGVVQVNGSFLNQIPINLTNDTASVLVLGTLNVEEDFVNNYECGKPNIQNDGAVHVRGNWVNNDTFWPGIGNVFLDAPLWYPNGGTQLLTGTRPTTFYNLTLDTFGVKRMTLDQFVSGTLDLRNSELAIDMFNMHVTNQVPGAVSNITGFASTLSNADNSLYGRLTRHTNDVNDYFYPMGSSLSPARYRPVVVKPNNNSANIYAVSFFNESPDNYGYTTSLLDDTTICSVNPNYFYNITREDGTADANLTLTYDQTTDGTLAGVVNWRTFPSPTEWKNTGGPFPIAAIGNLTGVTKVTNFDWNFKHFNLGLVRPTTPVISGPASFCGDFDAQYSFTPFDNNTTYEWDAQMGNVVGDSTVNPVTIVWKDTTKAFDPTQGQVSLVQTLFGCSSFPGTFDVSILSNPIANFTVITPYSSGNFNPALGDSSQVYTYDMLEFNNTSENDVSWYWNLGNSDTSSLESPFDYYENIGDYNIYMVATSPDGCIDTAFGKVTVVEGTTIPNAFSPNNDGFNDVFYIRNSNVSEYDLQVYNRWGVLVYKTTAPQIKWDGNSISGQPVSGGTYFWVLKAKYASGNEYTGAKKGYVELVRN